MTSHRWSGRIYRTVPITLRGNMKKNTKGAIALGAAALLLAGGAGTYAAWSDDASLGGGDVQTGHLRITEVAGESGWTWSTPGVSGDFTPATDTIAPGDSIRFEGTYKLEIKGTNLTAELVATDATTGALPVGLTWTPDATSELADLDQSDDGTEVTVGGTLAFDEEAIASMDEEIAIGDITVTLQQTAPAQVTP
ncbi:alternate-type signal peptide domain-containing protein [Dietzia aurantiaca]|uniref:alternate-type signal peptide domain-containing protein n=1 Tax=Dietzia aurantiaca TaxID=983873 RepID=UPI001E51EB4C|nr:alternate-type signal peptide domain-containing protein [Dietzia aurantiaca]MCD2263907.1 alternate-type signal peptide domain-containing protein [Dietzia aurantiaca]